MTRYAWSKSARGLTGRWSCVCRLLDAELESRHGSFAHLLETEGALAAPREKQIQLLNAELQPIVDMISVAYPDVEFGYYSKDLRAELAIHPLTDAVIYTRSAA